MRARHRCHYRRDELGAGGQLDTADDAAPTLAGAIYILDGPANVINNAGQIGGIDGVAPAIAINVPNGQVSIENGGTITGSILTGGTASSVFNRAGGVVDGRGAIALGPQGQLDKPARSTCEDQAPLRRPCSRVLVQHPTGQLLVDANLTSGRPVLILLAHRHRLWWPQGQIMRDSGAGDV